MGKLEQLKADLAAGKITVEQFKAQAKAALSEDLAGGKITQTEHDAKAAEVETTQAGAAGGGGLVSLDEVQRLIQSETDKIRTQYSAEKKALQDKLDEAAKAKMTEEEKAKYERDKWERERTEREKELLAREVKLHTVDKLREVNLPLEFRDILAGQTTEETNTRIAAFQVQWQTALKAAVDERFKAGGTDPNKGRSPGGGGATESNPWDPNTLNLTKQAQIMRDSPDRARTMASAFGISL